MDEAVLFLWLFRRCDPDNPDTLCSKAVNIASFLGFRGFSLRKPSISARSAADQFSSNRSLNAGCVMGFGTEGKEKYGRNSSFRERNGPFVSR
mmetsp:Transcript_14598/g.23044  ORF Transcript_14598/g.23044 Transcript_14598/m.23044 type:complete len:93 (+) Transcript_14598:470-748(+)